MFTSTNSHYIQSRQLQIASVVASCHPTILTRSFTKHFNSSTNKTKNPKYYIFKLHVIMMKYPNVHHLEGHHLCAGSVNSYNFWQLNHLHVICLTIFIMYLLTGMHMGSLCLHLGKPDCCYSSCTVSTPMAPKLDCTWAHLHFPQDNYNDFDTAGRACGITLTLGGTVCRAVM